VRRGLEEEEAGRLFLGRLPGELFLGRGGGYNPPHRGVPPFSI
jgi:hypothetical protein